MKKTTFLLISTCSLTFFNTFGMLPNKILYAKKYIRTVQTHKYSRDNDIKDVLNANRFKIPSDEEAYGYEYYEYYEYDEMLKTKIEKLYLRNNDIIKMLEHNIGIFRKQQHLAVIGDIEKIEKIEKQLHKSFEIKKLE